MPFITIFWLKDKSSNQVRPRSGNEADRPNLRYIHVFRSGCLDRYPAMDIPRDVHCLGSFREYVRSDKVRL